MSKGNYVIRNTPRLSLQGARLIMAAAARRAASIGVPMDIAVVDDAGHLLVFNRMDGAKLSSIDIAISKAWTAACAEPRTSMPRSPDRGGPRSASMSATTGVS